MKAAFYDINEAKSKVHGYQDAIYKAEQEIKRLVGVMEDKGSKVNVEELKKELQRLAQEHMDKAEVLK